MGQVRSHCGDDGKRARGVSALSRGKDSAARKWLARCIALADRMNITARKSLRVVAVMLAGLYGFLE